MAGSRIRPARLLLVGKAGAGKRTAASYLAEQYGFVRYNLLEKPTAVMRDLFPRFQDRGFQDTDTEREMVTRVKDALQRVDPIVWAKELCRRIMAERPIRAVVIGDGISAAEEAYLTDRDYLCFRPIEVECPDHVRALRLGVRPDQLEQAPSYLPPVARIIIDNSGPWEALAQHLDNVARDLSLEPVYVPLRILMESTAVQAEFLRQREAK
ncbi:MAG: hypothetical protein ACPLRW_06655 [Moorellales bacterium]